MLQRMLQQTVFINIIRMLQQMMIQRMNESYNSFYQYNQDATTNTDAATNAKEYYLVWKVRL